MTKKALAQAILALVITALLGGASLIIARTAPGARAEAPAGFAH